MLLGRDSLGLLADPLLGEEVPRPSRLQGLEGYGAAELGVEGLVDGAETAPADLSPDLVPTDLVPGLEWLAPRRRRVFQRRSSGSSGIFAVLENQKHLIKKLGRKGVS